MLTRLYLDNFRSFTNFEYKPEQCELLLGRNGSGKSSLLDAIRRIKSFLQGETNPFTALTCTRWEERPLQTLELEVTLEQKQFKYRLEIESRAGKIRTERLIVDRVVIFEMSAANILFSDEQTGTNSLLRWESNRSALYLLQFSSTNVRAFIEWISKVQCFRIDSYPGQMDEHSEGEANEPDYELDNLASWYRFVVQRFPEENARFLISLREAMDGFQFLRFQGENGDRVLRASFSSVLEKSVSYSLSELSEGQRCLIALYLILHFCIEAGQTVFIDEPDNFIALPEIQPWLTKAAMAAEDSGGQLIVVSHHPEILNQWAPLHGLRF